MRVSRFFAVGALVAGLAVAPVAVASADQSSSSGQAPVAQPFIVGGSQVGLSAAPFAAQVNLGGQFNCTGSLIASTWVLTAKHCDGSNLSVNVGSASLGGGTRIAVTRSVQWSGGDLLLLQLASSYNGSVATLGRNAVALNSAGNIYGWGRTTATGPVSPTLKTARVTFTANSTDYFGGAAYRTTGNDGQAWKGDSGGPFVVGGRVVGVASTSNSGGTNPNGNSWYTKVSAAGSWIQSVSGVVGQ